MIATLARVMGVVMVVTSLTGCVTSSRVASPAPSPLGSPPIAQPFDIHPTPSAMVTASRASADPVGQIDPVASRGPLIPTQVGVAPDSYDAALEKLLPSHLAGGPTVRLSGPLEAFASGGTEGCLWLCELTVRAYQSALHLESGTASAAIAYAKARPSAIITAIRTPGHRVGEMVQAWISARRFDPRQVVTTERLAGRAVTVVALSPCFARGVDFVVGRGEVLFVVQDAMQHDRCGPDEAAIVEALSQLP
jgi:hypothetical protein